MHADRKDSVGGGAILFGTMIDVVSSRMDNVILLLCDR
jgi:hypothetical protein